MELRGMKIPPPYFRVGPLSDDLLKVEGYRNLQTYFPTLTKVFRLGRWNSGHEIWMDTKWRVAAIDCSGTSGPCQVILEENPATSATTAPLQTKRANAFMKVTHLLDPAQWMQGKYSLPKETGLPWYHRAYLRAWQKLQDPGNQAYVDAIAAYALGRLREEGASPHFNLMYGAFCARANTYRYNLSEDFQSYRHERWFWRSHQKGLFHLRMVDEAGETQEIPEDILRDFQEAAEDSEAESSESEESLEAESIDSAEEGILESADSMSDVSYAEEDDESEDAEEGEAAIFAEFLNYPVMLILSEKNAGTMDGLFDGGAGVSPGSAEWEARWTAWLFQVIAALSCVQSILGFTHNDLHTNNIVWSPTEEEFLYYKDRAGSIFRVPTFGKVFRLIDFGRAIFRINGQQFISDDFKPGHDAEGQYAFEPLIQRPAHVIPPNPSFDLCRLAVSLMDGVFASVPVTKEGGRVLSEEPGLKVEETVSNLYNLLWSWMVDDEGQNIFINPDGSERFPDFDLYRHIAAHCFSAVPAQQFHHAAFDGFQVAAAAVPEGTKIYSLFC